MTKKRKCDKVELITTKYTESTKKRFNKRFILIFNGLFFRVFREFRGLQEFSRYFDVPLKIRWSGLPVEKKVVIIIFMPHVHPNFPYPPPTKGFLNAEKIAGIHQGYGAV